jgi:hypothetical protein
MEMETKRLIVDSSYTANMTHESIRRSLRRIGLGEITLLFITVTRS